ncbi:MAG: hypothetical protein EOP09_09375 [Proteobacteria bacterium]|nr:MAG: hypothetical protein EOP09_09375 [Pseudomonadota bacterium]
MTPYEIVEFENRPFVNKRVDDAGKLFTRHWGKAKLQLPDGKTVTVHSAHLWPFAKEESDTRIRLDEIREIVASIRHDLTNNSDSVLLQGDLNHTPNTPEYKSLTGAGLVDAFASKGMGDGFTANSMKPSKRIDYIYAIGDLSRCIKNCAPLFHGNFRMDMKDPTGFALSDHIPVLADFEF